MLSINAIRSNPLEVRWENTPNQHREATRVVCRQPWDTEATKALTIATLETILKKKPLILIRQKLTNGTRTCSLKDKQPTHFERPSHL